MASPRDIQKIVDVARHVHGGLPWLLELAEKISGGQSEFQAKHWGKASRGRAEDKPLPNVEQGLVELGELVSLVYLTQKGRDRELVEYEHEFSDHRDTASRDGTRPLLCFVGDGSGLVIVRGPSRYTVTNRGIEG
jgi:hypothetical protein